MPSLQGLGAHGASPPSSLLARSATRVASVPCWTLSGQRDQGTASCLLPAVYGVELFLKVAGLGPVEYLSSGWNL